MKIHGCRFGILFNLRTLPDRSCSFCKTFVPISDSTANSSRNLTPAESAQDFAYFHTLDNRLHRQKFTACSMGCMATCNEEIVNTVPDTLFDSVINLYTRVSQSQTLYYAIMRLVVPALQSRNLATMSTLESTREGDRSTLFAVRSKTKSTENGR